MCDVILPLVDLSGRSSETDRYSGQACAGQCRATYERCSSKPLAASGLVTAVCGYRMMARGTSVHGVRQPEREYCDLLMQRWPFSTSTQLPTCLRMSTKRRV